ncbi:AAA family ATPase domain protein [Corynebacterium sp. ATCC 6931]|nr:AAA family ATPase domain protein [Corynebacterium sp. ATCC 6931]
MADPNKLPTGGANGSADDAPGLFDEPSIAGPAAAKSQGRGAGPASTGLNSDANTYFHPGAHAPLAVRMRPRNLDEVVGQDHLLAPGAPLRRLVEGGRRHLRYSVWPSWNWQDHSCQFDFRGDRSTL